jgi:hypothetical protein
MILLKSDSFLLPPGVTFFSAGVILYLKKIEIMSLKLKFIPRSCRSVELTALYEQRFKPINIISFTFYKNRLFF